MAQAEVAAAGTVQAAVIPLDMVLAEPTMVVLRAVVLRAVVLRAAVLRAAVLRAADLPAVTLDHCVDFTPKSMTMFMRRWLRAQPISVHLADRLVADRLIMDHLADRLADMLHRVIPRVTAVRVAEATEAHPVGAHPAGAHREGVPITAAVIPLVARSVIPIAVAVPAHR